MKTTKQIKVTFPKRVTRFDVPIYNLNTKILTPYKTDIMSVMNRNVELLLDWEDINKQFKEGASQ